MSDLLQATNRIVTWRRLAIFTIPAIWLSCAAGMDVKLIISLGFCGVMASILSLRGQEGDA